MEITADLVLKAYATGYFPMAESRDDDDLMWIEPKLRGILPLDSIHIPRRLKRTVRQDHFTVTANTAFAQVLEACGSVAAGRMDTWINRRIVNLYTELHARGHAHSIEAWEGDELAGGLYGVSLGGAFFGESMFSFVTDSSKVALVHLMARLIAGGFTLLDTQFITEHLKQFGAIEIPRETYLAHLDAALEGTGDFRACGPALSGEAALALVAGNDAGRAR